VLIDDFHEILEPVFQGIANRLGEFYVFEALLRTKGNLGASPSSQIRQWEKSGFIKVVDLSMVLAIAEALRTDGSWPRVSVNVSMQTIEAAGRDYLAALQKLEPVARRIILELTGSVPARDPAAVPTFAIAAREMGYGVALDGCAPGQVFGMRTVWATLRPSVIKLDPEFFHACYRDRRADVLQTWVKMAHDVQAAVVAKHVDSRQLAAFALDVGMDGLQGFAIARPSAAPWREAAVAVAG
jgi:EAL domain-containing protein (putative c-di-GMP-specific phosphodiesterase class I)